NLQRSSNGGLRVSLRLDRLSVHHRQKNRKPDHSHPCCRLHDDATPFAPAKNCASSPPAGRGKAHDTGLVPVFWNPVNPTQGLLVGCSQRLLVFSKRRKLEKTGYDNRKWPAPLAVTEPELLAMCLSR